MTTPSDVDVWKHREPTYRVEPIFVERWSARAMSGEALDPDDFMPLFEAARWAPSSFNRQPWRFFYATRGGEHWETFLGLLVEGNRAWARRAALLIVVASVTRTDEGKPIDTHALVTGMATQNLLLQGSRMGLVVHAMRGFDKERAHVELRLPDEMEAHAMIAVGRPGSVEELSEKLQGRERPSGRKELGEIVTEGPYRK